MNGEAENGGSGDADTRSGVSTASLIATTTELDTAIASVAASTGKAKALVVHFRAQWCREPGDAMAQLLKALASHFPFQVLSIAFSIILTNMYSYMKSSTRRILNR